MERVAVLDFETTGLNPSWGDRPTEIAINVVVNGRVVDRFQSLMNPERPIPADVTRLTGITDQMVARAPKVHAVMREAIRFVGNARVVAHNASFDKKFWEAEVGKLGEDRIPTFACTMLLARRLYPECPNHKLGTVIQSLNLPQPALAHRATADTDMATHLWVRIGNDVRQRFGVQNPTHELLFKVQRTPKTEIRRFFDSLK